VCACVCVFVRFYACVRTYMWWSCAYKCVCVCVCVNVLLYARKRTHMNVHAFVHTFVFYVCECLLDKR
jgi:hypothetical protein